MDKDFDVVGNQVEIAKKIIKEDDEILKAPSVIPIHKVTDHKIIYGDILPEGFDGGQD